MLLSPAAYVIGKIGGLTKTATALGIPVTTVQGWKDRGSIPQKHWPLLIEAAKAEGGTIELADFLKDHVVEEAAA
jgi:hypothetical protein